MWVHRLPDGEVFEAGICSSIIFCGSMILINAVGDVVQPVDFCGLASSRFDRETARIGLPLRETVYPNLCQTGGVARKLGCRF